VDSLTRTQYPKFDQPRFLIFSLVFLSRDFEVGTNVSCEESTVSLRISLMQHLYILSVVLKAISRTVFTVLRYASAVCAIIVCLSVHPFVHLSGVSACLSQVRSSTKTAKLSITQTTLYDSSGTEAKNLGEIPMGSPPMGVPNRGGVG